MSLDCGLVVFVRNEEAAIELEKIYTEIMHLNCISDMSIALRNTEYRAVTYTHTKNNEIAHTHTFR